jgi:transglutaminase-like putative cysteine protease
LTRLSPIPAAAGGTVLAAIAVAPLLTAHSPWLKAAAAAIVICCAASASGIRAVRAAAGLVTYLAALFVFLNVFYAAGESLLRVIPTTASVDHLVHLAHQGSSLTGYQPPVNGNYDGIKFLAAGSIGLAAIVVDFLAVRLRKPAIAGLPLLVIFLAPIATTAHVAGLGAATAFLLAAAGYLALLSSDGRNRLRGWGRVVTVWHSSGEDERLGGADVGTLTATGRRIGLAAVCVALIAPLVLPTPNLRHLFSGGGGGGPATAVGLPDPVDQLHGLLTRSSSQPVLTYRSNSPDAGNYLQVYVLNYDKSLTQWDLVQPAHSTPVGSRTLQTAPGFTVSTPGVLVTSHFTLGQVTAGYSYPVFFLPVPYWPIRVSAPGTWREADGTLMIFSDQSDHAGQTYTVSNSEVDPEPAQLEVSQRYPASISKNYLDFSSPVTTQLTKIAARVTRGKTTAFAKAVALERWFHSSLFRYSLRSTNLANTPAGLLAFLTTSRTGYCQQFAFAMAVLARLVGIPSRVAVGYTAGAQQADGSWLVTTSDAHAWPELYFAGVGWVRFEPTPGGVGAQATAVQPAYVTNATPGDSQTSKGPGPNATQTLGPASSPTGAANPLHRFQTPTGAGFAGSASSRGGTALPVAEAFLGLLVLAAAAPVTIRAFARRRRWRVAGDDASVARAAWQELCADLEDYGLPTRASESPRAVARRVSAAIDDQQAREAVGRITTVVERARYAPSPGAAGEIRADVTAVRRSLARNAGRTSRWRARLLPASVLRPFSQQVRQAVGLITGWTPAAEGNAA